MVRHTGGAGVETEGASAHSADAGQGEELTGRVRCGAHRGHDGRDAARAVRRLRMAPRQRRRSRSVLDRQAVGQHWRSPHCRRRPRTGPHRRKLVPRARPLRPAPRAISGTADSHVLDAARIEQPARTRVWSRRHTRYPSICVTRDPISACADESVCAQRDHSVRKPDPSGDVESRGPRRRGGCADRISARRCQPPPAARGGRGRSGPLREVLSVRVAPVQQNGSRHQSDHRVTGEDESVLRLGERDGDRLRALEVRVVPEQVVSGDVGQEAGDLRR